MWHILASLLLLAPLATASPMALNTRQSEPCAPTHYLINSFMYRHGKYLSPTVITRIQFNLLANYSDPSIIEDPAYDPSGIPGRAVLCDRQFDGDELPAEIACKTGRDNFYFSVRDPENHTGDFQFIHQWKCNGQNWMASTHHQIDPLYCTPGDPQDEKIKRCTSLPQTFTPENVRKICAAPQC